MHKLSNSLKLPFYDMTCLAKRNININSCFFNNNNNNLFVILMSTLIFHWPIFSSQSSLLTLAVLEALKQAFTNRMSSQSPSLASLAKSKHRTAAIGKIITAVQAGGLLNAGVWGLYFQHRSRHVFHQYLTWRSSSEKRRIYQPRLRSRELQRCCRLTFVCISFAC